MKLYICPEVDNGHENDQWNFKASFVMRVISHFLWFIRYKPHVELLKIQTSNSCSHKMCATTYSEINKMLS